MGYKEAGQQILYKVFDPLVHLTKKLGITPNHITIIGFVLNVLAVIHLLNYFDFATMDYGDNLFGFGIILGFAGLMDTMDGRLARLYDMKSKFGAFFDSVIDRYSEFVMFMGLSIYFQLFNNQLGFIFCFVALIGSIMVSYARSRAEALGIECAVGFMQRPERIVFIGIWAIVFGVVYWYGPNSLTQTSLLPHLDYFVLGFLFLAIATNITAIRRVVHSEHQMNRVG